MHNCGSWRAIRKGYVDKADGLRAEFDQLGASGVTGEARARALHARRLQFKAETRAQMSPRALRLLERWDKRRPSKDNFEKLPARKGNDYDRVARGAARTNKWLTRPLYQVALLSKLQLEGYRSPISYVLYDSMPVPLPRALLPLDSRYHGFAHRRRQYFHAMYVASNEMQFQWGLHVAPWRSITVTNEVVSRSHRRFSVHLDGVRRQSLAYRRYRPTPNDDFAPQEVDRDWYLELTQVAPNWLELAEPLYRTGWTVGKSD